MIDWLAYDEIIELGGTRLSEPPQELVVLLSSEDISRRVPVEPDIVQNTSPEGANLATWYGVLSGTVFSIEIHDFKRDKCVDAVVTTPYSATDEADWRVYLRLQPLFRMLRVQVVTHIGSRNRPSACEVARIDPRGFDLPVYGASSSVEAESLAACLRNDFPATQYFVRSPDVNVPWIIYELVAGGRKQVGQYPDRGSALNVACKMSCDTDSRLVVKCQEEEQDIRVFDIFHGVVQVTRQ